LFFLLLIFLALDLTSAAYKCEDNSTLIKDLDEIDLGGKKTVNGLFLGLAFVDEIPIINRYNIELFVDPQIIKLRNTSAVSGEFSDKTTYSVALVNLTSEELKISVGGKSSVVEEKERITLGGLELAVISVEGIMSEPFEVDVLLGKQKILLSTSEEFGPKEKLVTYRDKNYLVEQFSTSATTATIRVSKCKNDSRKIIEFIENLSINLKI
jgi:hypothetical protein